MQKPYQVNILFAGFDEKAGPSLYWMDYLATMHKMNIAGNGYGMLTVCQNQHSKLVNTCKTIPWCVLLQGHTLYWQC